MGQVNNCLDGAPESFQTRLIQQQGERYRYRKPEHDNHKTDYDGVSENPEKIRIRKHAVEIGPSHPRTSQHAFEDAVFLPGDNATESGDNPEHDKVYDSWNNHQVQKWMLFDGRQKHVLFYLVVDCSLRLPIRWVFSVTLWTSFDTAVQRHAFSNMIRLSPTKLLKRFHHVFSVYILEYADSPLQKNFPTSPCSRSCAINDCCLE